MNNRPHYFPNARGRTVYFLTNADDVYACVPVLQLLRTERKGTMALLLFL